MCVAFVFQGISHLCSCCPSAIHKWGFLFLGNMGESLLGPGRSECSGDCSACEDYQSSLSTASSWGCWDSVTTTQLFHDLPLGQVRALTMLFALEHLLVSAPCIMPCWKCAAQAVFEEKHLMQFNPFWNRGYLCNSKTFVGPNFSCAIGKSFLFCFKKTNHLGKEIKYFSICRRPQRNDS